MRPYQYISTSTSSSSVSPQAPISSSVISQLYFCSVLLSGCIQINLNSVYTHCEMPPMATSSHSQRHFQKGSPQYPRWASYVPPRPDEQKRQVTIKKGLLLTVLGLVLFTFTMGGWFPSSWFVCIQSPPVQTAVQTTVQTAVLTHV